MAPLGGDAVDAVAPQHPVDQRPGAARPADDRPHGQERDAAQRCATTSATDGAGRHDDHGVARDGSTWRPGASVELVITIETRGDDGEQHFGEIHLELAHEPGRRPAPAGRLRAAAGRRHARAAPARRTRSSAAPRSASARSPRRTTAFDDGGGRPHDRRRRRELRIVGASAGATLTGNRSALAVGRPSPAPTLGVPSVDPGASPGGFIPLAAVRRRARRRSVTRTSSTSTSRRSSTTARRTRRSASTPTATSSPAAATSEDNNCCNLPTGPSPAPPNNVLAPFWTDLDGTGADGHLRRHAHRRRRRPGSSSSGR